MGVERARYWLQQWAKTPTALDAATIMQAVIACHAASQLGEPADGVRAQLARDIVSWSIPDLL
jgi:hypothetical protein